MSFKTVLLFLFLGLQAFSLPSAAAGYTMEDLEALEGGQNFQEFFSHAKDIRPSRRNEVWKKMVASMADKYLERLSSLLRVEEKQFDHVSEISRWSSLAEDEFYRKKRDQFAIKYIKQCLKQDELSFCHEKAHSFFHAFQREKELGAAFAEALYPALMAAKKAKGFEKNPQSLDLWQFVAPMAQSPYGEFYCSKEGIYEIVEQKLHQQENTGAVHSDCLKVMIPKIKAGLASFNQYKRQQAYVLLEKMNKLEGKEKAKYLVVQLLSGFPFSSDKWDEVLGSLKALGEDSGLREELLSELKNMERLPDRIFALESEKKVLILTKQLAKNFPEYLDFYAAQCLKWLNGDKDFVKGNPTPNCHRYFELSNVVKSSPAPVVQKYQAIMNGWKKI